MNRPHVATILTARPWEPRLVDAARTTGLVRIVSRAYEPHDLDRLPILDIVVAGSETAWVTPSRIQSWRNRGARVVGLHPPEDSPGKAILKQGGADATIPDSTPPQSLLNILRWQSLTRVPFTQSGQVVCVTGGRGAPGRTEIALALAWNSAEEVSTILLDLDPQPAVALRLGLPPGTPTVDVADMVRSSGSLPGSALHRVGPLLLLSDGIPSGNGPLSEYLVDEIVRAAAHNHNTVVLDAGPLPGALRLAQASSKVILVAEGTATSLLRTAQALESWHGPPPTLVLNRASSEDAVQAARIAIGLEPAAVVPYSVDVRQAGLTGRPPTWSMLNTVGPLAAA